MPYFPFFSLFIFCSFHFVLFLDRNAFKLQYWNPMSRSLFFSFICLRQLFLIFFSDIMNQNIVFHLTNFLLINFQGMIFYRVTKKAWNIEVFFIHFLKIKFPKYDRFSFFFLSYIISLVVFSFFWNFKFIWDEFFWRHEYHIT